jgi:hypothetical protein
VVLPEEPDAATPGSRDPSDMVAGSPPGTAAVVAE